MSETLVYFDVESIPTGASSASEAIPAGRWIKPSHPGCEVTAIDRILTEHYDFQLCFYPALPQFSLYPVPALGFFAIDNLGGSFVCDGSPFLLDQPMPIYYLDSQQSLHYIAPSYKDLLALLVFRPDWKTALGITAPLPTADETMRNYLIATFQLQPTDLPTTAPEKTVHLFRSAEEAKSALPFIDD